MNGSEVSDPTDRSDLTDRKRKVRRLRSSGGYRELRGFQVATLIYDGTVKFCDRFIDKRSRTHDQMVQAARSGRQNIAEGSRAGATSSKTETHLTNVARSSLDELLLDYEDYLRQRKLRQWTKDDIEAHEVRSLGRKSDRSDLTDPTDTGDLARWALYAPWLEHKDPAIIANTLICLIHQANYLMDQQIIALEQSFIKEGGYSEQLAVARLAERERLRKNPTDPSDQTDLIKNCPICGQLMAIRTARQGKNIGSQFWGCTGYPTCKGTRPM
ncbi:MAG: four helix bundle suffix domain-containing protein [bacterium]|jgi:restriction system protein